MKIYSSHQLCNLKTRLKDAAKEAGNVLFMILIAVALFTALAYSVTQSTRSGGGDASKESNILLASQLTQYATALQTSIERMRISNGCADTQISFENPKVSGYTNPNAPSDYRCHVFRPEGGNVAWQPIPNGALDTSQSSRARYGQPYFTGQTCVYNVGTGLSPPSDCWNVSNPMSSQNKELILGFPLITLDVCNAINAKLKPSWTTPPIEYNGALGAKFTGVYPAGGSVIDGPNIGTAAVVSGCIEGNSPSYDEPSGSYHYFHVLLPR